MGEVVLVAEKREPQRPKASASRILRACRGPLILCIRSTQGASQAQHDAMNGGTKVTFSHSFLPGVDIPQGSSCSSSPGRSEIWQHQGSALSFSDASFHSAARAWNSAWPRKARNSAASIAETSWKPPANATLNSASIFFRSGIMA
jgi:hypothetical protein